jgi:hypothetical protein
MISQEYLDSQKNKLIKALAHLEYSYNKILKLPEDPAQFDEEILETWESFSARFCRVADMFLMKYLRTLILMQDPGFTGSLRDFLNQAEKLNYINSAELWLQIRELRNIAAHEYSEKDLALFFQRLRSDCIHLLNLNQFLSSSCA